MIALFRRKPVALDLDVVHFILAQHDRVLDVHERAALYAARVAQDSPREGSHGAKVLQIWENTASEDGRALVEQGLPGCETELAKRILAREGKAVTVSRCGQCGILLDGRPKTCRCGGRTLKLRLH